MATLDNSSSASYSARGNVFDSVTRQGIGGLLVTVYDVYGVFDRAAPSDLDALTERSVRIGSVLTDEAGAFSLEYDQDDLGVADGQKRRPDLLLVISAPDDEKGGSTEKVIYSSKPPRVRAGKVETFSIGVSHASSKKFGLKGTVGVQEAVSAYKRDRSDEKALADSVTDFHREEMAQDKAEKAVLRAELLNTIATNPAVASLPGELVRDNGDIRAGVSAVAAKGLGAANTRINESKGVPVNLYLTKEDRKRLKPFFDAAVDGFATIPEHELKDTLFRINSSENPGTLLIHQNPIARFCSEQTFEEKCARLHTGLSEGVEDHHGEGGGGDPLPNVITGPNVETLTNKNLPRHVARLLSGTPSPDGVLTAEFNAQRASKGNVEDAVDKFSLRKGPAEVPAFYDFQSLQIAFEHVWKILIDEDLVNAAHAADKKYVAKTGGHLVGTFSTQFAEGLAGAHVYNSIPQEVPDGVATQFDINRQEWIDLSPSHRSTLEGIARLVGETSNPAPPLRRGSLHVEKTIQDLREQGERLIDGVRHDDYYTLHKTLRDLNSRLNSAYEFTVFAADKNSSSVNFGLLNTYRQEWAPIHYQAGALVKTIPLSPKEERKYSLKTTRNVKYARKEALKNNRSLTNEQTSTTRVEADIMAKAQSKTNFGLNTEGTFNIGIAKGKATTTFGVEAQQESSETRKDFREAVLKAVQDYKDERSVQVDTEESTSHEYTESGTVVNPNDELSVTYLFYELQRRYRVSERLHRVQPVVLVAQEVPAPHQITEAWVLSHDWIINRHLLDDSFRPALQYLANKSVGDDFALRELRKNLRQQRNLVDTLRLELSISADETRNRYRALERLIEKRIVEESDEATDGVLSDIGDFFGVGGGGQDPEAAKARELAAKDAHQYAVEKAEKAAAALRQEVGTLHTLTAEYNATLRDHLDNETRCKRLMVHIRNNIFYYMQAIWSMEPPDQRFLRLHKVQVPVLKLATLPVDDASSATVPDRRYRVEVKPSEDLFENFRAPGTTRHRAFMSGRLQPITEFKPLVEVANLDDMLGFKGNYMIFPLKEHNALTEFMAAPYVDSAFGAMDPDELSNVTLDEFGKYICCLHEKLPPEEFEKLKPQLKKWLELLLADPLRNGEEIVVPTNCLFIEVLAGTHTLLENFKLRHRELDVYKVQAEVRRMEMENLRLAARLINAEREDPDIEKKIVVEGGDVPNLDVDNS